MLNRGNFFRTAMAGPRFKGCATLAFEMRDKDLRSPNFLDVEKYPTITFHAKQTKPAATGTLQITGDLTIHGVTKEVVLDVDGPSAPMKDPWDNQRIGASATTKINRKDFAVIVWRRH